MEKSFFQTVWDFIGFPLRAFLVNERTQKYLGLTTLKEERLNIVLKKLKGKTLDIGCGDNELIKSYRKHGDNGVGADVIKTKEVDRLIKNPPNLPFKNRSFDSVSLVASLNHINKNNREKLLKEIKRVLKKKGRVIVTMINSFVGFLCHKLTYWDSDQNLRKIDFKKEEDYGLSSKYVESLFEKEGFNLSIKKRFLYGLNILFVFEKK
jgi:ubiquinone/menaquinone biosynthesis C-methylase UbiE